MAVPATVIYFTVYDQLKGKLGQYFEINDNPIWTAMLAGGTARTFAASTISPLEMIRTKMQSKKLSYWEVGRAIRISVESDGWLSLWRGVGPTLLRDVPFSMIYWANYEYMKKTYNQKEPTFAFSFAAGAISGTVAAILTLPFDVVKTHRQIELGDQVLVNERRSLSEAQLKRITSTSSMLKNIYSQRGISGLFAGITPRIIKVAPACAIMISVYEFGKSFFKQYNSTRLL